MSSYTKVVFENNDTIYSALLLVWFNPSWIYNLICNVIGIKIMFVHYAKSKKSGIYLNGVFSTYLFWNNPSQEDVFRGNGCNLF